MMSTKDAYIRGWNDAIAAVNTIISAAVSDQTVMLHNQADAVQKRIATLSPFNNELLDADIMSLGWSVRVANAVLGLNVKTVRDLIVVDKRQLRQQPNLGEVSLKEIERVLGRHGLRLSS